MSTPTRPGDLPRGEARPGDLPSGEAKRSAVTEMFDTIAPRYDLLNRLMTFGIDRWWRRRSVRSLRLASGATVLDLACGTGDLCRDLADAAYRPIGVDLSAGMLRHATTTAPLLQADGLVLPFADGALDGVVSGFALRNVTDLDALFVELGRVVRPGGRIALLEVATPANRLLRTGHAVYFGRVVPLVGAALSDGAAYRYLPRSVAYLPEVAAMLDSLRSAGFIDVGHRPLSGGIAQLLTATRGTP